MTMTMTIPAALHFAAEICELVQECIRACVCVNFVRPSRKNRQDECEHCAHSIIQFLQANRIFHGAARGYISFRIA